MGNSAGVHRWVRRSYEGAVWGLPALALSVVVGMAVFVWLAGPDAGRYGAMAGALFGVWLAIFVSFTGVLIKTDMLTGAVYMVATLVLLVAAVRREPALWACLPPMPALAGCVRVALSPSEQLEPVTAE